jgi:hypothetical protein
LHKYCWRNYKAKKKKESDEEFTPKFKSQSPSSPPEIVENSKIIGRLSQELI